MIFVDFIKYYLKVSFFKYILKYNDIKFIVIGVIWEMLLGNSFLVIWGSIFILNFINCFVKLVLSCGMCVLFGSYFESYL